MHDDQNKRRFSRIILDAPVIISRREESWKSGLIDICLNGALIHTPYNWPDDDTGEFNLDIDLDESDTHIRMQGHITHEENNHIGFVCDHIDLDSIARLKRLVLLNLGDESMLERELSCLAA